MIETTQHCSVCGEALSANTLQGLCRRCLLRVSLGVGGDDSAIPSGTWFGAIDSASELKSVPVRFADYELVEEIARGGMGVVYRAQQRGLNRTVALKMIGAGPLARPEDLARFRNEAEAVARLQHPNIIAIYDVGEQDGQPWFAMQYVAGPSLAILVRRSPLGPVRTATILRRVCGAIAHAHQRGILHRDLKPSNILLDEGDEPRVTDFGLAKFAQRESDVTGTDRVIGSPGYMAPEQAAGHSRDVDARSDVYSLGAVLYEMLTGRPPFQADTAVQTLKLVVDAEPVPPRQLNPAIPADLQTICLKCLAKEPVRRYATAPELAEDLAAFLENRPIRARPSTPLQRSLRWCRRKPALAITLCALSLSLDLGLAGILWQWRRAETRGVDARNQLYHQLVARAHAQSRAGEAGAAAASLSAIRSAVALRGASTELRSEAITALALPELVEIKRWHPPQSFASLHCFSDDLRYLARWQSNGVIEILQTSDDAVVGRVVSSELPAQVGPFSPDGRSLVIIAKNETTVHEWSSGTTIVHFAALDGSWPMVFSANNQTLCNIASSGQLTVASVLSGAVHRIPAFLPTGTGLTVNPEGSVAALIGRDDNVHWGTNVWFIDLHTGIRTNLPLAEVVYAIAWSPAGDQLAVSLMDQRIRIMDPGQGRDSVPPLVGHGALARSLRFSGDGSILISGGLNGSTILWDAHDGRQLGRLDSYGERLWISQDGQHIGLSERHTGDLVLYNFRNSSICRSLSESGAPLGLDSRHPAFTSAGLLLVPNADGGRIFRLRDGHPLAHLAGASAEAGHFDLSHGEIILMNSRARQRWTIQPTNQLWHLRKRDEIVQEQAGSVLPIPGEGYFLYDWNIPAQIRLRNHSPETLPDGFGVFLAAVSEDGQYLAGCHGTGGDTMVNIWDSRGNLRTNWPAGEIRALALGPKGKDAFLISGQRLLSINANSGRSNWQATAWAFTGHNPALAVTPDGRILAAQLGAFRIAFFDADTGEILGRLEHPQPHPVQDFSFSPDSGWLAVACAEGVIQLWNLRELRAGLAELGLDWGHPPLPPAMTQPTVNVIVEPN